MKSLDEYELSDLKRIYRALHGQLQQEFELLDSDLLHDLQRYLQNQARGDGTDVSVHSQWSTWLNDS